jgi:CheY-like chemotaxis protein
MINPNVPNLRCLIVDDHAMMRKIIKDFLTPMNITNIAIAENGKIAYEKLHLNVVTKQPQFNIVFMDLAMPEVDGYALLKQCRSDSKYDNVAFVVVTAENQQEQVMRAIKIGATSFLSKPFTENEFNEKFVKVIKWLEEREVI